MLTSIAVSDFIQPRRGSGPYNALHRAELLKPTVELIGEIRGEKYFRVQAEGRDRHCVIIWIDELSQEPVIKCDCEAHYVPQTPQHCYHLAAVLIDQAAELETE